LLKRKETLPYYPFDTFILFIELARIATNKATRAKSAPFKILRKSTGIKLPTTQPKTQ
jgi:hypothetical protein